MKKTICLLLSIVLALLLAACGGESGNPTGAAPSASLPEGQTQAQTEPRIETIPKGDSNGNVDLENVHRVAGKDIYINVPNWQRIDQGYTKVFIINGQKYVAVTCEKHSDGAAFEEAHEIAFAKFKANIQNYSYVNSLNVEKESVETVNGIKVYRFEGKLNCGHDTVYDAYAVGYSFIMDNVACNVTGSVIDQEQPQAEIDAMRDLVDAMIQTLRSQE